MVHRVVRPSGIVRSLSILSLVALAACSVRGASVRRVAEHGPGASDRRAGIYYSLPKSLVTIEFPMTRESVKLTRLGVDVARAESVAREKATSVEAKAVAAARDAEAKAARVHADAKEDFKAASRAEELAEAKLQEAQEQADSPGKAAMVAAAEKALSTATSAKAARRVAVSSAELELDSSRSAIAILLAGSADAIWSLVNLGVNMSDLLDEEAKGPKFSLGLPLVATRSEPDPEQAFFLDVDGSADEDRQTVVALTELGILSEASGSVKSHAAENAIAVIGAIGKIGGAAIKSVAGLAGIASVEEKQLTSSAIPLEARVLAARLEAIETARLEALKAPAAGGNTAALELTRSVFDAEIEAVFAKFAVRSIVKWTMRVEVDPATISPCSSEGGCATHLFRFGASSGVDLETSTLRPYVDGRFRSPTVGGVRQSIAVRIRRTEDPSFAARVASAVPEAGPDERSIHYRVPVLARVGVERDGSPFGSPTLTPIPQWGAVAALPARLHGSGFTYLVQLYEATGALKKVDLKGTAVDVAGIANAIGTTGEGLVNAIDTREAAIVAARKAKAEAGKPPTELELLGDEKARLQLEFEIQELKKKLGRVDGSTGGGG